MNTSELIGKQALDKDGNNIGKVVDIEINLPQWTIDHIVLKAGMIKKSSIKHRHN